MKSLFLFFLLLFIVKHFQCNYLMYSFIQNKYDNFVKPSEIISGLLSLEYYTNITIAEPPQTIKSYIDFTKFHFYISNVSSNREYLLENSKSFYSKYDHDIILYTYSFVSGKYANETLFLDLNYLNASSPHKLLQIKNFTFSMPSVYSITNRKMYPSSIGLGFYAHNSNTKLNFLTQLVEKGVLNNSYFFIDFDDDFSGKLYLGVLPHDIYPKKFSLDDFYKVYTNIDNVLDEWSFRGDLIYNYNNNQNNMNNSIYKANMKLVLDMNLNGLILDYSYFSIFNKTFFHDYLNDGICKIEKEEYYYLYCEKDKININKFKTIYFYQKEFNYTFNFDYKDLFLVKNNYIIFNIFFDVNGFDRLLHVGKIIFRKYLLAFNYENKMIGFYKENNNKNGLIIEENNNHPELIQICGIIFGGIVLISLIIIFIRNFYGNKGRKIRKNELDDNYDYSIQNNDE